MYKNILIATDGSELATRGLEQGLALAGGIGAKVTVLTVIIPLETRMVQSALAAGAYNPTARYDESIKEELRSRLEVINEKATAHGVAVNVHHEIDEAPAEAIVRVAKRENCDLIVLSSHGYRGMRRLFLGSQTSEVLALSEIPVLVVR